MVVAQSARFSFDEANIVSAITRPRDGTLPDSSCPDLCRLPGFLALRCNLRCRGGLLQRTGENCWQICRLFYIPQLRSAARRRSNRRHGKSDILVEGEAYRRSGVLAGVSLALCRSSTARFFFDAHVGDTIEAKASIGSCSAATTQIGHLQVCLAAPPFPRSWALLTRFSFPNRDTARRMQIEL